MICLYTLFLPQENPQTEPRRTLDIFWCGAQVLLLLRGGRCHPGSREDVPCLFGSGWGSAERRKKHQPPPVFSMISSSNHQSLQFFKGFLQLEGLDWDSRVWDFFGVQTVPFRYNFRVLSPRRCYDWGPSRSTQVLQHMSGIEGDPGAADCGMSIWFCVILELLTVHRLVNTIA